MVAIWHSLQFGVCQDCAKKDSWPSSRKPRLAKVLISFKKNGEPDRIRTCDVCLRRAVIYPAKPYFAPKAPLKSFDFFRRLVQRLETSGRTGKQQERHGSLW